MLNSIIIKITFYISLCAILFSCSIEESVAPVEDTRIHFLIHPWEYSTNHYIVDTIYSSINSTLIKNHFGKETNYDPNYYTIKEIKVWRNYTGLVSEHEFRANAFVDLPFLNITEKYSDIYRDPDQHPRGGRSFYDLVNQRFIELKEFEDFSINRKNGIITLLNPDELFNRYIAVAFKIEGVTNSEHDDLIIGELDVSESMALNYKKRAVVKLIKSREDKYSSREITEYVKQLHLKNIYTINSGGLKNEQFDFDIYFLNDKNNAIRIINELTLLNHFGLDENKDGKIDLIEGITIMSQSGEIIFPLREPFGDNIPTVFGERYKIPSIYFLPKSEAINDTNAERFYFTGRYYSD